MTAPAPAASREFARRYGRLVPAGLHAPPGACSRLPAWWGREHWVDVQVHTAVMAHPDWAREEHVDRDTAVRVARAHARYADNATGRNCRPTNERLALDLQMSARQIQRARRLLKRLGLLHETARGRSIMTKAERLAAWRNGSSHRRLAAEFALTSPRTYPQPGRHPVERVTPPRDAEGKLVKSPTPRFFTRRDRGMRPALRAAPPKGRGRTRPARPGEARTRRLIAGLQAHVPWLSGVSPRRLTSLHRFAEQGWTERDVMTALDDVLLARGWRVPDELAQPAAYLAALLREVDPADRPGAYVEAALETERVRREWLWRVNFDPTTAQCPHGQPLGHEPHPLTGVASCPLCRRA